MDGYASILTAAPELYEAAGVIQPPPSEAPKARKITRDVYVDSDQAVNGVVTLRLEDAIESIETVALLEAEVPLTYHVVRGGRVAFSLRTAGVTSAFEAALADGTYTMDGLGDALTAAMAAASGATFAMTADTLGVATLSRTDGPNTDLIASASYASRYATDMLAFAALAAPARSVRLTPKLAGPHAICVRSNAAELFHARHALTPYEQTDSDIMDRLQRSCTTDNVLLYKNLYPIQNRASRACRLSHLTFWLTFLADREPLDFRGAAWSLKVRIVGDAPPTNPPPWGCQ